MNSTVINSTAFYREKIKMEDNNICILVLCVLQSLFSCIPLCLHVIGIHLLRSTNSYERNQKMYLVQLSILEIIFLICNNNILLYIKVYYDEFQFTAFISLFLCCVIGITWTLIVMFLTLDRFAQVYLNIKYSIYFTGLKVNSLLAGSWMSGILSFLLAACINVFYEETFLYVYRYVLQVLLASLVLTTVACYAYIYRKIQVNRRNLRYANTSLQIVRHPKAMFIPFWIVFTCFWLFVFPNLIQLIFHPINTNDKKLMAYFTVLAKLLFVFGCIADVVIYIIMNNTVKRKFLMLFGFKVRKYDEYELCRIRKHSRSYSKVQCLNNKGDSLYIKKDLSTEI